MQVGLYLLLVLHIAEGCKLKDGKLEEITAYTGGSALLPCYCTDPQATPGRFTWKKLSTNIDIMEEMSSERSQYRDRVQLVNGHSPGNLSLLISLLTEEDGGWYICEVEGSIKDIILTVKGCSPTNHMTTLEITAHTGGSVLLPCSCAELRAKPKTFSWNKYINPNWDMITFESDQYRDRVQLFNGHSPGNLSLLISHLTEGDGGDYRCHLESGYTDISLTVKAAPTLRTSTLPSSTMSSHEAPTLRTSTLPSSTMSSHEAAPTLKTSTEPSSTMSSHEEAPATKLTPTLSRNIQTSVEPTATISSQTGNSPLTNARAEPPQSLPFVPFGLVTVIILHIIVAVVYHTKRNKVLETARIYYNSADEAVSL
ncbi:V-set and immunoglobulin domain-containing protein 1-like isoform X2 [Pygocentrus nattereri]|uniref:V-set and immunoglobulin domain-containing protein 1-like isoform X2 n=1 Tax=Pygocentrus nattereri TaxID=42514 RepID=UPI001890C760|nr:V-set and immunoglobulin domain-containing protein 1-like isoform X2 [Pygocentrus nattereri]